MTKTELIDALDLICGNDTEIAVAFEADETAKNVMSIEEWSDAHGDNIAVLRAKGNSSELIITDLTDQVQILKNALELAERENERLKAIIIRLNREMKAL